MLSDMHTTKLNKKTPFDVEAAILNHYVELMIKENKRKHPLYNKLLALFREAEIPYTQINQNLLNCGGLLHNVMFRPDGNYCHVFINSKPYSVNLCVNYSIDALLAKLYLKGIISLGTYGFLIECNHTVKTKRYVITKKRPNTKALAEVCS